jgi:hypothetical protein
MKYQFEGSNTSYGLALATMPIAIGGYIVQPDVIPMTSEPSVGQHAQIIGEQTRQFESIISETSNEAINIEEILEDISRNLESDLASGWVSESDIDSHLDDDVLEQRNLMLWYQSQLRRLYTLDGQHHPDGYVATNAAINAAAELVQSLYNWGLVPDAVNATPDSNILLEFAKGDEYDSLEVLGEDELVHTSMRPSEGVRAQRVSLAEKQVVGSLSRDLAHVYNAE